MDKVIHWTPSMLKRFKKQYAEEVEKGSETFMFDGNEFVVGYAKYLIEFLDIKR